MRKAILLLVILMFFVPKDIFCQGTQIQHIDFLIKNATDCDFRGVVWIDAEDVYLLIPEFDGFSFIVTTTNSPGLAVDLKIKVSDELESQPLDEDGDGKVDRIGVYMSLKESEKKVVTIHVGQVDKIIRIKGQYKKFCDAVKLNDKGGVIWESDKICYSYDPTINIINIFGKMTYMNILDLITAPYYDRSKRTTIGEEFFITKKAPGFGGLGIMNEGGVSGLSKNTPDKVYISGKGPIASCLNILSNSGTGLKINSQYTLSRGSRWTWVDITLSGNHKGIQFVTGIPVRSNEKILSGEDYIATFADSPSLGLAVYVPDKYLTDKEKIEGYHLAILKPDEKSHIQYAFSGHWELEHNENVVEPGELDIKLPSVPHKYHIGIVLKRAGKVLMRPQSRINSIDKFKKQLNEDLTSVIRKHIIVEKISEKAVTYTELYPPEAVRKNRKKSYSEALDLMINRLRIFAEEGLAIEGKERFWFKSTPEGKPNFINPNRSWGDGYWVSMLWDAYKVTGDSKFKKWALQSNRAMLGGEDKVSFATGLNYWNSSARSYEETKDNIWRESAIKCADAWLNFVDPITGFITGGGSALQKEKWTKIDAMICVPIMYWVYKETKDKKYLDMAARHTDLSMRTLIEPDGATLQMIWFSAETGDILGIGTPQGSGGSSRWARSHAWTLDGFADVYIFTREQKYLNLFRLCTKWLMKNLPKDFVPWYDFDDQGVFYRYRDTSTASICAHALLRMSEVETDSNLAKRYIDYAVKIIDSILDNYLTKVGTDDERPPGMLSHQTYTKEIADGELIWGSYNLMKALCLLTEKGIQRK